MLDNATGGYRADARSASMSVEDEDVLVIAASGLFHEDWYGQQNPDVARSGVNPLLHYVHHGAAEGRLPFRGFNPKRYLGNATTPVTRNVLAHYILHGAPEDLLSKGLLSGFSIPIIKTALDRLRAMPVFNVEDYLTLNQEVRPTGSHTDVEPANHALVYGFPEGRHVFMKTTVARVMGAAAALPFPPIPVMKPPKRMPRLPPIGVFFNASGNAFLREIAEDILQNLLESGQDAILLDDTSLPDARPPLCIFVAPHEFFHIGNGPAWAREDILKDAFMFTTEQPQTLWFERSMPFVLMARGVIDIAWQVTQVFHQAGIPAAHFNPNIRPCNRWLRDEDLQHPLVRVLPKPAQVPLIPMTPVAARPIDISFFGTESEHRERFFTRNVKFFADYEAFLYYRKVESPMVAKGAHAALSRLGGHVAAHSKIALNIHRDSDGFFEWHRIAKQGIVSGSVVVSEPCPPHPVFKAGTHYLEESGRHILNLIDWLLKTPDGQKKSQEIQNNAIAAAGDKPAAVRNGFNLVSFLQQHHGAAP